MFLCFKSVDQLLKTRDKILEEALRQLNEEGLDKVSIRSIAQALGMQAPANTVQQGPAYLRALIARNRR